MVAKNSTQAPTAAAASLDPSLEPSQSVLRQPDAHISSPRAPSSDPTFLQPHLAAHGVADTLRFSLPHGQLGLHEDGTAEGLRQARFSALLNADSTSGPGSGPEYPLPHGDGYEFGLLQFATFATAEAQSADRGTGEQTANEHPHSPTGAAADLAPQNVIQADGLRRRTADSTLGATVHALADPESSSSSGAVGIASEQHSQHGSIVLFAFLRHRLTC
ncbi:hypothetical protein CALVIDRAFT_346033 [Calocera viscosa TUFC12733]|uniref:Uncharacterized protein n=1 Tax=Calocera viscosa (strain TUFC12733) TaxID=1330018 RepID=A0A167HB73_CALVF|nr:hypothetical protein CALVIDRAFT_346033 [Calocera viscosa TUFC12733]